MCLNRNGNLAVITRAGKYAIYKLSHLPYIESVLPTRWKKSLQGSRFEFAEDSRNNASRFASPSLNYAFHRLRAGVFSEN